MFRPILLAACLPLVAAAAHGAWSVTDVASPDGVGRRVEIKDGDRLVGRFIHGTGQLKPYLHVFGDEGDLLTEWDPKQQFPHHRGIFIGWNKISSDLGTFDLWHLNNGGRMIVTRLEKLEGNADSATLVAQVEWHGGKKDATGSDLILTETRTLTLSRPGGKRVQVDASFQLKAARDLKLDGDLQHAGIHFRGHHDLTSHQKETSYLWSPANLKPTGDKLISTNLEWCRLEFPIGPRWYAATQLNSPGNPVEQLSTRAYGRFGFFFKRSVRRDEVLPLHYRFLIDRVEPPAATGKLSAAQEKEARGAAGADYQRFAGTVPAGR